MIRDRRVWFDPTNHRYREQRAADEIALESSIPEDVWDAVLEPLSAFVMAIGRNSERPEVAFPTGVDSRLQDFFNSILTRFAGENARGGVREPLESILEKRLARYVGTRVMANISEWLSIASLFQGESWHEFVYAIPPVVIDQSLHELMQPPIEQASCTESFGPLRDNMEAVLHMLDELRGKSEDEWIWLDTLDRQADVARLNTELSLRSELLSRMGPKPWLNWATKLPHPLFTAIAINQIMDIDFLESLIEQIRTTATTSESQRLALLLLVRRVIKVCKQIDHGLVRAATMTFRIAETDHIEYQQWLEAWLTTELPSRVSRIFDLLENSTDGSDMMLMAARHINIFRGTAPAQEHTVLRKFRDELIRRLVKQDVDVVLSRLLENPTPTSLLTASLLVQLNPTKEHCQTVIAGYSSLISSENFFWNPQNGDNELNDAIAFMLSYSQAPSDEARALLHLIQRPSQGWGFDLSAWRDALPRIAHVLVVISQAASQTLAEGNSVVASEIMELSWTELDVLLRNATMPITDNCIIYAVAYVYAHASRTLPNATTRLSQALARIDDIHLLISAATNFKNNAGGLTIEAKLVIQDAFDSHVEILERSPHVTAEDLTRLRNSVDELLSAQII